MQGEGGFFLLEVFLSPNRLLSFTRNPLMGTLGELMYVPSMYINFSGVTSSTSVFVADTTRTERLSLRGPARGEKMCQT